MVTEPAALLKSRSTIGFLGGLGLLFFGVAALLFAASTAGLIHKAERSGLPASDVTLVSTVEHSFELVQLGTFRRDQFLVDKKTGRVWQSVCSGKASGPDCDGMVIWSEMYVSEITPEDSIAAWEYNAALKEQLAARKK